MKETQQVLQSVLFDISKLLQIDQEPGEVFENVLRLTRQVIPFERSTLYLWDSRTEQLEQVASIGEEIELAQLFKFTRGSGMSAWTAHVKRPIILGDIRRNGTYDGETIHSFLSVPLMLNDSLIGVLNCGHPETNAFDDNDLARLQIVGSQIAGIVEHARSTIQLMEKNIELEQLNTELQETQSQLISSEKLATVGQMAVRLSHEVNNPLTIISGTLELLMGDIESSKDFTGNVDIKGQFKVIETQIKRIGDVLDKLVQLKSVQIEQYSSDGTNMLVLDPTHE
ncbi:MAG: GAF domain-containing protein [Candidatus Marinimicrobia bacterium]|nr:GAF domain-containing protein [Candidatus Neomarinimicrobiota bacterium]MCF7880526.1 GAF domain-containing protein [Candidatus Neomarinimicrobiota bacterium]